MSISRASDERLLKIAGQVDAETLKAAFRLEALKCHPDVAGESKEQEFVALRAAYERLRDGHWKKASGKEEISTPRQRSSTGAGRSRHSPDFADILDAAVEDLTMQGRNRQVLDELELEVPLDYFIFGATLTIHFPVEMSCRKCGGKGRVADHTGFVTRCPVCQGTRTAERQIKVPLSIPPGHRSGDILYVPLEPAGLKGYALAVELTLGR
jgi:DnaJ-class molecular chaperone